MSGLLWAITGLFAMTVMGVIGLKWHDPNTDATFIGVIVSMVMGMVAFLTVHFKIERIPTRTETKEAAVELKEAVKETAKDLKNESINMNNKQTQDIKKTIEETRA